MLAEWLDEAFKQALKYRIAHELFSEILYQCMSEFSLTELDFLNAHYAIRAQHEKIPKALAGALALLSENLTQISSNAPWPLGVIANSEPLVAIAQFVELIKFLSGRTVKAPLPSLDSLMAQAFGFEPQSFHKLELYEPGVRFLFKLRDLYNHRHGEELDERVGAMQVWQVQSLIWWNCEKTCSTATSRSRGTFYRKLLIS
jgi:hypothetical protein